MNIIKRLKSVIGISNRLSISELEKTPLMKEKWISVDYLVPIPDSVFSRLRESRLSSKEKPSRMDFVMSFVMPHSLSFPDKKIVYWNTDLGLVDPMFSFIGNIPTVLIRFRDKAEEDYDLKEPRIRQVNRGNEKEYMISPISLLKHQKDFLKIEETLTIFGLKQFPKDLVFFSYNRDGVPIIRDSDGVFHLSYPFEKRLALYLECPKWEKGLFAMSTPKKIEWILDKENMSEYMHKYCSDIREILNRYDYKHGRNDRKEEQYHG
ncbi:MAG TPA: hypothetical protein HA349_06495 [Methanotrichaceae archaeon]|nr:hypothetical protein [Methanotrichaceae archaeon]